MPAEGDMNRAHFFRPDICVNDKPVAKQALEQRHSFAQEMALAEFNPRGNALSASVLKWPRGFVLSRGKFFEALDHKACSLGLYQTERAAARATLKAARTKS